MILFRIPPIDARFDVRRFDLRDAIELTCPTECSIMELE